MIVPTATVIGATTRRQSSQQLGLCFTGFDSQWRSIRAPRDEIEPHHLVVEPKTQRGKQEMGSQPPQIS